MLNEQESQTIPSIQPMGFKNNWLVVVIIILALILAVCIGYYFLFGNKLKQSAQTEGSVQITDQPEETRRAESIVDPGVSWLPRPEKMGDLKLFDEASGGQEYYKIADLANEGQLIYAYASIDGVTMSGFRFVRTSDGIYFLLAKHSHSVGGDFLNKEKYEKNLVRIDYATTFNTLIAPQILPFGKILFIQDDWFSPEGQIETEEATRENRQLRKKIGQTMYGDLFEEKTVADENPKIKGVVYLLKLSDTSVVSYTIGKDFLAADGTLIAALNDNGKALAQKKFSSVLCANIVWGDAAFDDNLSGGRLFIIGTTPSGDNLYIPADKDDEILKVAYESYKLYREQDENLLSYESFVNKKSVLIWRDPFENYIIFVDKEYQSPWDCQHQI